MYTLALLLLSTLSADDPRYPELWDAVADSRTIWYNRQSLPPVYESSGELFRVGYNLAGRLDRTGSANNEHPWLHTGGMDNCGPEVTARRMLWLPPDSKIALTRRRFRTPTNNLGYSIVTGQFPEGTLSAEFMYEHDRLFEIRSRRLVDGEWQPDQIEYGAKPRGYVAVDNCTDCHKDIGKHSMTVDVRRDWYGTIRGLQRHGPIHWHPWEWQQAYRMDVGAPMRVRQELRNIVTWR